MIPPKRFEALNLFGVLFCRRHANLSKALLQHERIHSAQMREMLFVGFYLWYAAEWLFRLTQKGNAYEHISLEREAYAHMHTPGYLQQRRPYAWTVFLCISNRTGR